MKINASEPGFLVSGGVHAILLLATLIALSNGPKFEDASETAPVEVITDQQFNQIMKGEKTAKAVLATPAVRADQQADTPEPKPRPSLPPAKADVPTPPPPMRRVADPGQDETPPARVAALPPDRPPDLTTSSAPPPPPPPRPEAKAEPPPPPDNAEPIDPPMPPERPKFAQDKPSPPQPPKDRPTPKTTDKQRLDAIAKLLDEKKLDELARADTPASRPRAHDDRSDSKNTMNPTEIAQLLSRDAPQQRASTGRELSRTASLGSPTASAAHMSPSMWGALDGLLQDQYKRCWSYLGLDTEHRYVPQIRVQYSADGALVTEPSLLNPPGDPSLRSLADSAMRAVRRCNPLKIPPQFAPYFDQWKARILRFDPEEMSG